VRAREAAFPRTIELMTASKLLGEQVRALLRRFGILASFRAKRSSATNGKGITRDYHRLSISGDSLRVYLAKVGFDDERKDRRLAAMLAGVRKNSNREGIYTQDVLLEARALGLPVKWVVDHSARIHTLRAGRKPTEEMAARLEQIAGRLERGEYTTPGAPVAFLD
jgi:hypothetical protein